MKKAPKASAIIAKRIQAPSCTARELAGLVGKSVITDRLIASHRRAGTATLKKLSGSRDRAVLGNVASNPKTPLEVLINIAKDYPRWGLWNSAANRKDFEDPGSLKRLSRSTLAKSLEQAECPPIIIWAFVFYASAHPTILSRIIRDPSIPVRIIEDVLRLETDMDISSAEGLL